MIYDPKNPLDAKKATTQFDHFLQVGKPFKMEALPKRRSSNQNAMIHVIFDLYAIEFGYTSEEAKTFLKRECGELMRYKKGDQWFLKSTSGLTKDECQTFIEWMRNFCSSHGLYIPSSEEYLANQIAIDKEINNNKQFIT